MPTIPPLRWPARSRFVAFWWPWLLAALPAPTALAQTPVSGTIDTSTTWTTAGSPYVLGGDVEVVGGATLTMLAGVRVEFEPGSRLLIGGENAADTGRLFVAGTRSYRVNFVSNVPGEPAGGVELRPGAAWDADGTGSAIRFARFESVHQPLTMRGAAAELDDLVVLYAGDSQRPAIVVELDSEADTALRATAVRVLQSAGGGMSVEGGGNHELVECRFVGNAARGLRMHRPADPYGTPGPASEVLIERCEFIENAAAADDELGHGGGALLGGGMVFAVEGCTFESNTSERSGGGLYMGGGRDTTLRSCAFTGNTSRYDGGGLYLAVYEMAVEDCRFSGNTTGDDGGGMSTDGSVELRRCVFEGNDARWGGAAYGRVMAVDCEFVENFARYAGGAMLVRYTTDDFGVLGGVFRGNRADGSGGAIDFTYSYAGDEVRIEDASFIENRADLGGAIGGIGGRTAIGGRLTLVGNHFEANLATRGGALHVRPDAKAGLRLNLSAEGEATNTFRGNIATVGDAIANDSAQGVEARGVCWGVPTTAAIGTLIHDGLDDPALGVVAIDPIATGCLVCRADLDGDGELTIFDFLLVQGLFAVGDLAADFDGDGVLTMFDFLVFQNEFDAGCL